MKSFIAAALLALPTVVSAQVVDINQPSGPMLFGATGDWDAQSFTTTGGQIVGAGFQLFYAGDPAGVSSALEIRLYNGPASTGATLLASGTATYSLSTNTPRVWADAFWTAITLDAGQYYLYVTGAPYVAGVSITHDLNVYGGGMAYRNYSTDIKDPATSWAGFDLSFRTFAPSPDLGPNDPPVTVAEPGTWALLVLGAVPLGLLTGYRRRGT